MRKLTFHFLFNPATGSSLIRCTVALCKIRLRLNLRWNVYFLSEAREGWASLSHWNPWYCQNWGTHNEPRGTPKGPKRLPEVPRGYSQEASLVPRGPLTVQGNPLRAEGTPWEFCTLYFVYFCSLFSFFLKNKTILLHRGWPSSQFLFSLSNLFILCLIWYC